MADRSLVPKTVVSGTCVVLTVAAENELLKEQLAASFLARSEVSEET